MKHFVEQFSILDIFVLVLAGVTLIYGVQTLLVTSRWWHVLMHRRTNWLHMCHHCALEMIDGRRSSDGRRYVN